MTNPALWSPHEHRWNGVSDGDKWDGLMTHVHSFTGVPNVERHSHPSAGLGRARMTPENRRKALSDAGRKGKGPRAVAAPGDTVTSDGYKLPSSFTGQRKRHRNLAIIDLAQEGWTDEALAAAFNCSVETIRQVRRYFEPVNERPGIVDEARTSGSKS